jgi:hypothetical protein
VISVNDMRKYIAEKWKDFVVVLLISASVVCILLDIVKIFSVTIFYAPYKVVFPALLMIGLRLFDESIWHGRE